MSGPARDRSATLADFLAIPEDDKFHELIDGEILEKASPSFEHGMAQQKICAAINPFGRRGGPDAATLLVYRREEPGWREVLAAQRGDTVRAEPFETIEIRVGTLFGDDEDDDGA